MPCSRAGRAEARARAAAERGPVTAVLERLPGGLAGAVLGAAAGLIAAPILAAPRSDGTPGIRKIPAGMAPPRTARSRRAIAGTDPAMLFFGSFATFLLQYDEFQSLAFAIQPNWLYRLSAAEQLI